jgi:TatA/E family protein of Tat protein translocase
MAGYPLLIFDISGGELIVIVAVIFLLFGPKKIPEIARMLGKGMSDLRRATDHIRNEISKNTDEVEREVKKTVEDIGRESVKNPGVQPNSAGVGLHTTDIKSADNGDQTETLK